MMMIMMMMMMIMTQWGAARWLAVSRMMSFPDRVLVLVLVHFVLVLYRLVP